MSDFDRMRMRHGLTGKQARFIVEYAIDFNGTRAAGDAGYKGNLNTLRVTASRNLTKDNIQAALSDYVQRVFERAELKAEDVLRELARVAFSRIDDVISWDQAGNVTFRPSGDLTPDELAGIRKIRTARTEKCVSIEVEQHQKMQALTKLFEYFKLSTSAQDPIPKLYQLLETLTAQQLRALDELSDDDLQDEIQRMIEGHRSAALL